MIFETFNERKRKRLQASEPDVFIYDKAGPQLRHQICMAIYEGIGSYYAYSDYDMHSVPNANVYWKEIDRILRKEIYSYLGFVADTDLAQRYLSFLNGARETDDFLSAVEVGCNMLSIVSASDQASRGANLSGQDAIEEVNARFLQHAIGYRFEGRLLVEVSSEFLHAEIIKPALRFLSEKEYSAAEAEFFVAHSHYRTGAYKDAVTAANRSFECILKAICDSRGWEYGKGDRASDLVTLVNTKGLFTHSFDKAFSSLIAWLKAGLPTIRNDAGAHGDSLKTTEVTAQIARFAINTTASNIVFLAEVAQTTRK